MNFIDIKDAAEASLVILKIQHKNKQSELNILSSQIENLESQIEEQEGMLEDANLWLDS
jgi:hypothetical protein|tara:strand:+ start:203 stop:379 length:177 start_codon:yes stop_codon:yes gene_type:complete